ncbi:MAG: GntR family transcriptional regulator [Caldilineaceae bacterium]
MQGISRQSPTPLYEQIKLLLRDQILSGQCPPGSQLPSEAALCAQYGVSRITVVRALGDLEDEGLIIRRQGRGSQVREGERADSRQRITGFSGTIGLEGNAIRSKVLGVDTINDNADLAMLFGMPVHEKPAFMRIRRLRFVDDRPAVIMNSIMLASLGKRLLEHDLESASFYRLYETIWGVPVIRNETSLTPILAHEETAALLDVKVGSPHYLFRGFSYLQGDIPVELCLAIFRGNLFTWNTVIYKYQGDHDTGKTPVERTLLQKTV